MNLAQYAKPAAQSASKASITSGDFEIFLETCATAGDFYIRRVYNTIYWNAVVGTYNAIKNQYGDHAATYIAMMEKQKSDSADVVYWMHSDGFRPDTMTEEGLLNRNSIEGILTFVEEEYSVETETVLVISHHIRELKKHNKLMSARMHKAKAMIEFNQLPEDIRIKYQAIIDNNLATKIANQKSAMDTLRSMFSVNKDTHIDSVSENKLYKVVSKLDEEISNWIEFEEQKKFEAAEDTNKDFIVDRASATIALLDAMQSMASSLVKRADIIEEQTNTSKELITQLEDDKIGLNDQTDAQGVNQYNGGYNVN